MQPEIIGAAGKRFLCGPVELRRVGAGDPNGWHRDPGSSGGIHKQLELWQQARRLLDLINQHRLRRQTKHDLRLAVGEGPCLGVIQKNFPNWLLRLPTKPLCKRGLPALPRANQDSHRQRPEWIEISLKVTEKPHNRLFYDVNVK